MVLRLVIGQAIQELRSDPYDLAFGRRELGVHRIDEPSDVRRAMLAKHRPPGLGDVQQHLAAIGRIIATADQTLLLKRGEHPGQ